jgi:D-alanine-D-alanine ligase
MVERELTALGFAPVPVPLSLDLDAARSRLQRLRPSFVFNLVESVEGAGRLIHLGPVLLESIGLSYTGAASEAVLLTSKKTLAKRLMADAGIATPPWMEIRDGAPLTAGFPGPYIVKSVWEHASIGIDGSSIVNDPAKLAPLARRRQRRHGGEWFAEQFIDGREFNLSLLSGPDGMELLPPAEMTFRGYPPGKPRIVDYAAKWHADSFEFNNTVRRFDFPPEDGPLLARLAEAAQSCCRVFGLSGYARVDCRVDASGRPQVLEVNVNPCLSPDAGFAAAVARAGLDMTAAIARIVAARVAVAARPPARRPAAAELARAAW